MLYSGQYSTFKIHVLPFFSALTQVEKENDTKGGLWESSAILSPDWAFNIIPYMTQYIAY